MKTRIRNPNRCSTASSLEQNSFTKLSQGPLQSSGKTTSKLILKESRRQVSKHVDQDISKCTNDEIKFRIISAKGIDSDGCFISLFPTNFQKCM